jgi:hypothetical protein
VGCILARPARGPFAHGVRAGTGLRQPRRAIVSG